MLTTQFLLDLAQRDNLATKYKTLWIAYSGGVDSHVLLDLAHKSFSNVRAIHVNHGLSADDDLWQSHCEQICAQLQIPLYCVKTQVKIKPGQSPEAAARIARRHAWLSVVSADDLLLVAHHADDQAETILYRLLRGAGPHGLSGMHTYSKVGNTVLLRPLLNISKQEIITYAQAHSLDWIADRTNQDNAIDRNYIRNNIMPLLQNRWPAAVDNINRAGQICAQMVQCLEPQLQNKLTSMVTEAHALDLQILNTQTTLWQQECLRAWLRQHDLIPSTRQIKLLLQQVIAARIDAMPQLHIGSKVIKRSNNKLFVLNNACKNNIDFLTPWDVRQKLRLPTGQDLHAAEIFNNQADIDKLASQQVTVRMGVLGRKAKKIFQQHAIPPWERAQYPLVFADNRLVSIVGLWCSARIS